MAKHWRIVTHDSERIARLERAAGLPTVLAQLLVGRGIMNADDARLFLEARLTGLRDPDILPGARDAARRLAAAVREGQRIVIYGDYDADGMTGTAILFSCLKLFNAQVNFYVPNRLDEGYGLNDKAIRRIAAQGTDLIVTVDCGIASLREASTARSLGVSLLITDHHEPADRLPDADVIVHPRLPGHAYPFSGLAGSAVALKVAWALCQEINGSRRVPTRLKDFLLQAVGLAALGTVADVVPLLDENRILVRHGLNSLRRCPPMGVSALSRITRLESKASWCSEDIAFTLAPRLNAAGRLGQAALAIELLTTDDPKRVGELARYVHELNGTRDRLERKVYLAARRQIDERYHPESDSALVLAGRGWHAGVVGIVAGRLAEKYHRPVVLIALDKLGVKPGIGSARSVAGFALHEALQQCADYLLTHGGHAAAAGLTIRESQVDRFREAFCELAASEIAHDQRVPQLHIDAETPLTALSMETVQQIERLAPFGQGNPRPVLCASGVHLVQPPRQIGDGGRHLSVVLGQHGTQLRSVAFGGGEWLDELSRVDRPLSVAFKPVINEFRGRRNVELHLADWRASQPTDGSCRALTR